MDRIIKRFDCEMDRDLMLTCRGIAYQREIHTIDYGKDYLKKVESYDEGIEKRVIESRIKFVESHYKGRLLDIGAGSGEFVRNRKETWGNDINPATAKRLKEDDLYSNQMERFDAYTFWDVIEHVEEPESYFKRIKKGSYLFASLPIFQNTGPETFLKSIRKSKHYRPDEHLYYFTEDGFTSWMAWHGFRLLEASPHEIKAGREGIIAFAFKKDLPDYHDYVGLYKDLHDSKHYGASAHIYLKYITEAVHWLNPASILDYGCGRSDLVAHYYLDGERVLGRYDPAIGEYKTMPKDPFDLVLCCDVMEHIPLAEVDKIFKEIKRKSKRVIFVISTKLARAKLPNGQNAHITILTKSEWVRWLESYFGKVNIIPTKWDHVLMVKSFGS